MYIFEPALSDQEVLKRAAAMPASEKRVCIVRPDGTEAHARVLEDIEILDAYKNGISEITFMDETFICESALD